eukprot:19960-Eustigmatos_ZCMA.PRE.1
MCSLYWRCAAKLGGRASHRLNTTCASTSQGLPPATSLPAQDKFWEVAFPEPVRRSWTEQGWDTKALRQDLPA